MTTGPLSEAPRLARGRSPLIPIFLVVLVDVLGLTIVLPLLPLYAESFGASAFVAALLVPTYALCQMLAGPALGDLSDRIGRKPVLLLSQAGTFIGFLIIAGAQSLWMIFVGRILDGLTAGNLSVAQAYIADNTAPRDRARSFALIGIAFGLGFTLGPALTAYLSRFGMSVPLYAAAALSLTSIGCTITLLPAERKVEAGGAEGALKPAGERLGVLSFGRYAQYFRRPVLSGLLAEFFFYLLAFSMFMSGFALFAERRYFWHGKPFTPHEIGWLFTVGGVVGVIIQGGLLGRLVSRLGERRLIGFGLLCLGTGYALLDYVDPIVPLVAVTVLSALGNALLRPCLTSLITQVASREEQGVVLGLTQSLASTAAIAAAPLSGWFIDHLHLAAWGWVAAGFCAIALFAGRSGSSRVRFDPSQTDYGGPTPAA